ncbi:hypothetical protein N7462_002436 [Penicillium macrosclerotiorum]|uniref:uncharacterized protein n=1 Tax=Penicillium macrosclerotiorum TaxID=303699 RepID=UPI0025492ADB|nr:uncharacterized protein N7462_002436 [Penicillium macrosclerotiorum]KAJ5693013.1 hypothetical protein N7462_002436 [Penicillium macrosclerotiorum]
MKLALTPYLSMQSIGLIGLDAPTSSSASALLRPTMMPTDPPIYYSPKRKREPSESDYYSPSASPTSTVSVTSLQDTRFREEVELGRNSPRAAVAGRFGELAIRGERFPNPRLPNCESQPDSIAQTKHEKCAPSNHFDLKNMPEGLPAANGESHEALHHRSPVELAEQVPTDSILVTPASTPSKKRTTLSPLKRSRSVSPSKIRKQRLSPPLTEASPEDPFTWHDHEITGHNPTDPTDDGYGINGVGFKPTAAIAWARSQKRQKQVAEWKNREAREAREKRREKDVRVQV